MNKKIIEVLKIIYKKLKNKNIKWVVSGSLNLLLQGIPIKKISDIDIMTTKKDAFKINEILKEFEIKPVKFGEKGLIKSYWGQLKIKGMKVDIVGEFSEKFGNKWVNIARKKLKSHKSVKIKNMKIPASDLQLQLKSYKLLKRKKDRIKIRKIEKFLKKKSKLSTKYLK